jgi:hypothetical protein
MLFRDARKIALEPAPLWVREPRSVFQSRRDEPNGSTRIDAAADDAIVHISDFPLLATLLFSNTRVGRPIAPEVQGVEVFVAEPPPASAQSFADVSANVVSDSFGSFYEQLRSLGRASLAADGSVRLRVPSGTALRLSVLDGGGKALTFPAGAAFTGPLLQREEMQFYPGERSNPALPRQLFNGLCGGCHGSITGRELEVVVDIDVLGSASRTLAGDDPIDLR